MRMLDRVRLDDHDGLGQDGREDAVAEPATSPGGHRSATGGSRIPYDRVARRLPRGGGSRRGRGRIGRRRSLLHPRIVAGVGVHGRTTVIDGFGTQFVVPGLVAVDLAQPVLGAMLR